MIIQIMQGSAPTRGKLYTITVSSAVHLRMQI